ncbi:37104_t:CDS:1 [Racocetra persica]|uniref:37104_t:CDS:1 n=1 Tax=Racocetra persica TaxID=160502 RepID=A0ACA9L1R6_9GLOM|nr:37104_t:CDS:1 [Racocetra persica]
MNPKSFNLFLLFLSCLLAFTIFVNAGNVKPCENCCKPGGPGRTNQIHRASPKRNISDNISSAEECCNKCLSEDDCIQWAYGTTDKLGLNTLNTGTSTQKMACLTYQQNPQAPENALEVCKFPSGSDGNTVYDSGIIRCLGGCFV